MTKTGDKDLTAMLSQSDKEILLALLVGGAGSPNTIGKITGRHTQTAQSRLSELEDQQLVYNKGAGVYDLTLAGLNSARILYVETEIADSLDLSSIRR